MKTIDDVHIEAVMTDEFITNFVSTNVMQAVVYTFCVSAA